VNQYVESEEDAEVAAIFSCGCEMRETSRVSVSEELNECIGEQDDDAVVDNDLATAEYLNDDIDGGSIWWGRDCSKTVDFFS